jgi:hypothetical protein
MALPRDGSRVIPALWAWAEAAVTQRQPVLYLNSLVLARAQVWEIKAAAPRWRFMCQTWLAHRTTAGDGRHWGSGPVRDRTSLREL